MSQHTLRTRAQPLSQPPFHSTHARTRGEPPFHMVWIGPCVVRSDCFRPPGPETPRDCPVPTSIFLCRSTRVIDMSCSIRLYMGPAALSPCPHVCTASIVSAEEPLTASTISLILLNAQCMVHLIWTGVCRQEWWLRLHLFPVSSF